MPPVRPKKLGHLVLAVRDIRKSVKFYTEILGLKVSDWIAEDMVFLRCAEDHHDLALAQIPPDSKLINGLPHYDRPGLEHFSYLVEDLAEMERFAKFLVKKKIPIVRRLGKHGPGQNLFLVFKDPDGNNVEVYCEMEQIPHGKKHKATVWPRSVEAFDQWRFKRFLVPPPAALVAEKSGRKPKRA